MKITQINLKISKFPPPSFAVLIDPTKKQIEDLSKAMPRLFILPFFIGPLENLENMSDLTDDHVLRPFYIGNLDPDSQRNAINAILEVLST